MKPIRLRIERPSRFNLLCVAWFVFMLMGSSLWAHAAGAVVASNALFIMAGISFLFWIFLLLIKWSRL